MNQKETFTETKTLEKNNVTSEKIYCANCVHCKLVPSPAGIQEPILPASTLCSRKMEEKIGRRKNSQVFYGNP